LPGLDRKENEMQHSMLIRPTNHEPSRGVSGLKAVQHFAQRDGADLIRILRAAAGLSGVAAAECLLDSLWSRESQPEDVRTALAELLKMIEDLPSTIDRSASEPDARCDELDNAIRYFGARLTDLAGGLAAR
jgi:hypothetical protein